MDGEEFLGWYKGDECISSDEDYWFEVEEAVELKAVFTNKGEVCVNAFVDCCKYDSGELYAKITYIYILEDCTVLFAIYDKGGKLQKLASNPAAKNSETSEFTIPITDALGYDYKVFFWKNTTSANPVGKMLNGIIE